MPRPRGVRRGRGGVLRGRAGASVAVVLASALMLLSGCSAPPARSVIPEFVPAEDPSPSWQSVPISITGLQPGTHVVVTATAISPSRPWTSTATYPVPVGGTVSLGDTRPQFAPFTHADSMGLFWSLRGPGQPDDYGVDWATADVAVLLRASVGGRVVASRTIHREGQNSLVTVAPVLNQGFTGDFYQPRSGYRSPLPALVVFDSDENDATPASFLAGQLASLGYPALVVRASQETPDITHLTTLELGDVRAAVSWLDVQTGVDHSRVYAMGVGNSAQLALWAASEDPDIFGAMVASGTSAVVCGDPYTPAVDADGQVGPCQQGTEHIDTAHLINVGAISGPVIMACGTADTVLPNACEWMRAAESKRPGDLDDRFVVAQGAGHEIAGPPFVPLGISSRRLAQATEDGRVQFWRAVTQTLGYSIQ